MAPLCVAPVYCNPGRGAQPQVSGSKARLKQTKSATPSSPLLYSSGEYSTGMIYPAMLTKAIASKDTSRASFSIMIYQIMAV